MQCVEFACGVSLIVEATAFAILGFFLLAGFLVRDIWRQFKVTTATCSRRFYRRNAYRLLSRCALQNAQLLLERHQGHWIVKVHLHVVLNAKCFSAARNETKRTRALFWYLKGEGEPVLAGGHELTAELEKSFI